MKLERKSMNVDSDKDSISNISYINQRNLIKQVYLVFNLKGQ